MNELTRGRHLVAEYRGCASTSLDSVELVEDLCRRAVLATGAHIVQSVFHQFSPQGVSGVVVIQESHCSVHTWPEVGYAAVDFYTCGDCDPTLAHGLLAEGFGATEAELMLVHRGLSDAGMQVQRGSWNASGATPAWVGPNGSYNHNKPLLPQPSHYFLAAGTAEGLTSLNAFDNALLDAGVGDTNLLRVSSILPPGATPIEPRPLPAGSLVPIAYAEMTSDVPGQTIAAAVAVALPLDPNLPGLIMEHHGVGTREEIEHTVREMALSGMQHRQREVRDVLVRGAEHTVEKNGAAFASVVLWHDL